MSICCLSNLHQLTSRTIKKIAQGRTFEHLIVSAVSDPAPLLMKVPSVRMPYGPTDTAVVMQECDKEHCSTINVWL